jgi:hypothetical protein
MRSFWSRGLILFVVLAFASGAFIRAVTAGQPCLSLSPMPAASAHQDHAAHHHSPDKPASKKEANEKCCGICIVASAGIVPIQAEITETRVTRIDYPGAPAEIAGLSVVLDPGIPKRPA